MLKKVLSVHYDPPYTFYKFQDIMATELTSKQTYAQLLHIATQEEVGENGKDKERTLDCLVVFHLAHYFSESKNSPKSRKNAGYCLERLSREGDVDTDLAIDVRSYIRRSIPSPQLLFLLQNDSEQIKDCTAAIIANLAQDPGALDKNTLKAMILLARQETASPSQVNSAFRALSTNVSGLAKYFIDPENSDQSRIKAGYCLVLLSHEGDVDAVLAKESRDHIRADIPSEKLLSLLQDGPQALKDCAALIIANLTQDLITVDEDTLKAMTLLTREATASSSQVQAALCALTNIGLQTPLHPLLIQHEAVKAALSILEALETPESTKEFAVDCIDRYISKSWALAPSSKLNTHTVELLLADRSQGIRLLARLENSEDEDLKTKATQVLNKLGRLYLHCNTSIFKARKAERSSMTASFL